MGYIWDIGFISKHCLLGRIGHLLEKALKNASKWLLYMVFVLYAAIGIYLEIKLGDGAKRLEDWYKDYQYQKEFEYKYKVDL